MAEQKKKTAAKNTIAGKTKKTVSKVSPTKKHALLPPGKAGKKKTVTKPKVANTAKSSGSNSGLKKVSPTKKVKLKKTAVKSKSSRTSASGLKKPPYKKPKKDEECFLTTACVKYYGLPDDTYELTTLRTFRNTYMSATTKGKELIKQYYSIAPGIVALINKDTNHKTVYQSIYTFIQKACIEIEKKHFAKAQNTYVALVRSLQKRYNLIN